MKVKDFIGKKVYDRNAIEVGKISDLEIDTTSFTLEKVFIKSGMTKQYTVSPQNLDRIGDTVILKVRKEDLR